MPPKKISEGTLGHDHRKLISPNGLAGMQKANVPGHRPSDNSRSAFTSAMVAALKELERRPPPSSDDLGRKAYDKLQFDFPLATEEELDGLTSVLRGTLHLKAGTRPLPLSAKMLANIVAGARAHVQTVGPAPTAAATSRQSSAAFPAAGEPDKAASTRTSAGGDPGASAGEAPANGNSHAGTDGNADDVATAAASATSAQGELGSHRTEEEEEQQRQQQQLEEQQRQQQLQELQLQQQRLQAAYRRLCAVVLVPLVTHCLAVPEQETWALLHGLRPLGRGGEEEEDGEEEEGEGPGTSNTDGGGDAERDIRRIQEGMAGVATSDAEGIPSSLAAAAAAAASHPSAASSEPAARLYEESLAAEEDGDDFVFEDLDPSPRPPAPPTFQPPSSISTPTTLTLPAPPPYDWPALRSRLLGLSSHVSYGLLDEPSLWSDGQLVQEVFELLRALGAHRHSGELQPLLHAYVGLVADRIADQPQELGCLDSLWDAVGVPCLATAPQQAGRSGGAGAGRGRSGGVLQLAEASTCLSLVAGLAAQLGSGTARGRLWQQVHMHMLPLLERCLGELARGVTAPPGAAGAGRGKAAEAAAAVAQGQGQGQGQGPSAEDVAAIVLVCQVLDFYVEQRPANADLGGALKSSGVLASLCRLFAAAAHLPGAEPLRGAALGCAASGRELREWMVAVPGVAQALAAAAFREGGPCEAHGAVWQLLTQGGSSPTALAILQGGAAPEKAGRVHALLQLMAKASACQGPAAAALAARGGGMWGPEVERAMRELFAALRVAQAAAGEDGKPGRKGEGALGEGVRGRGEQGREGDGREEGEQQREEQQREEQEEQEEEEEEDDDDKLHMLDPEALVRRRAKQLHPVCWRLLKQLLASTGAAGAAGKTD